MVVSDTTQARSIQDKNHMIDLPNGQKVHLLGSMTSLMPRIAPEQCPARLGRGHQSWRHMLWLTPLRISWLSWPMHSYT